MNRGKTDALTAVVDRDLKQELAHPTNPAETDNSFSPEWIDDRVRPGYYGERRNHVRKAD